MTPADPSTAAPATPLRLLLVEDDEFDAAVFGRAFNQSEIPCEIVRCRSGEEVLAGLRDAELDLDLVVADHRLPGISGFDLCVKLLEDDPAFAVVLLTGGGSEQMAIRALRAGIQDYIVKDTSREYLELLPLVLPRVARRHQERQDRRRPRAAPRPAGSPPGLPECAALVRQRGGRLWVEAADGAAPTLHFTVPLAPDEIDLWSGSERADGGSGTPDGGAGDDTEPRPAAGRPAAKDSPRRVLIAHPNPIVTYTASRTAERAGYRFVVVEDGRKAVEAIERERFDVVLIAVSMPELDGLEATRRIRQREDPTGSRVPIIALGTDPGNDEKARCLAAGLDAVVPRPVDSEGVSAALAGVAAATGDAG